MTNISPSINEGFQTDTDNDAILAALLQNEEDSFSKMTVKNISQQNCSKQMIYQLSSEMIGTIAISSPPEDNAAISRDDQIALALQRLEED